ncbi:MAG: ATP-binding protein, partial [Desulfoprunum sp.]|nr:ATP-binding protein [Desulfoprunum sp.]
IDQEEYLLPIKRLQRITLAVAALMAVISLLIGWKSADTLLQPLLRLVAAVNKTEADNLVFTQNIAGKDEIGTLAKAFAAMTGRLQQTLVSRDTLQQEVEMRRNTEIRLKNALVQLDRSNKELEQFAYVASHDLQEPLRMVSSFVQLLGDRYRDQLDEKARKYIHYAVDGAARMQILIQELLAFSRVSTRGLDFERIDALTLLAQAEDNLKVAIAEAAARITHNRLPMVLGDKSQLVQVFQNLIGNAIKFCKDGPPSISIGAEKQGDMWRFAVRDNGIGIDQQYAEKIFVIFQRLHTREEYPGTGIGLSLCKRIVERHGGTIWFESEVGKGTTFFFTLLDQDADRQNET